jgi:cysteinyl-tRNA synthetase
MLQANYKSILDFSDAALLAAEKGFYKLMEAMKTLNSLEVSESSTVAIKSLKQSCYDAMNDDFNTPVLIANLFEGAKFINSIKDGKETISAVDLKEFSDTMNAFVFEVLGLKNNVDSASGEDKLSSVVGVLIQMRKDARDNKDWALSDKIRDELLEMGIQLKDGKDGTTFSVN